MHFIIRHTPNIETIHELVNEYIPKFQDYIALRFKKGYKLENYYYNDIIEIINRISSAIYSLDVEKSGTIAIIGENSPEYSISLLAIMNGGFTALPISSAIISTKGYEFINKYKASVIFIDKENFERYSKNIKSFSNNFKRIIILDNKKEYLASPQNMNEKIVDILEFKNVKEHKYYNTEAQDIAGIFLTSKSNKPVALTHKNIFSTINNIYRVFDIKEKDRTISVVDQASVFEFGINLIFPLLCGSSITYIPERLNFNELFEVMREEKITVFFGTNIIYNKMYRIIKNEMKNDFLFIRGFRFLLSILTSFLSIFGIKMGYFLHNRVVKKFGLKRMRYFICGGGAIDKKLFKFFNNFKAKMICGYGTTETASAITFNPVSSAKYNSVGKSIPGIEIYIKKSVGKNDINGEILIRGESVFKGYYKDSDLTEQAFYGSWFKTGDYGYIDKNGYLYII